jgi:P4 family phage/plasmid primase-like protien
MSFSVERAKDIARMCWEQGYAPIPISLSAAGEPIHSNFGNGETYPPESDCWNQELPMIGVRLENCILLDYDGAKADRSGDWITSLEELAAMLGLDDMPNPVQEDSTRRSLHWIFKLPAGVDVSSLKQCLNAWHPFIDVKVGNQLVYLKPHKVIPDDELPHRDALPVAPEALLKALKKPDGCESADVPQWDGSTEEVVEARQILGSITPEALEEITGDRRINRDDWVMVLMGIHNKFGGVTSKALELADWFSQRHEGYVGYSDVEKQMKSFTQGGGVTFAQVCKLAEKCGCDLSKAARERKAKSNIVSLSDVYAEREERQSQEVQMVANGDVSLPVSSDVPLPVVGSYPTFDKEVSDYELAHAIRDFHFSNLRCSGSSFYIRDEHKWVEDNDKAVFILVKDFIFNSVQDTKSHTSRRLMDVAKSLQSTRELRVAQDTWDSCPFILNTPAGIVDLRSGEVKERKAEDYVTMVTQCSPVAGETPMFDRFMAETFSVADWGENAEQVRDFVIDQLALCLSGEQIEQLFFFWHGKGANGKSVLMDLIKRILGQYATKLDTQALTKGSNSSKGYAIAGLKGQRLATASEVARGDRWDDALLKQLTGESEMSVRQIYGSYSEIELQATLVVAGNHKPNFNGGDGGMVRRMVMIPFRASIPKDRQDRFLTRKLLEAEGDAIMHRLVERAVALRDTGLSIPECINKETDEYVNENDDLKQFFDDYLVLDKGASELSQDIFDAFAFFKSERKEAVMGIKNFSSEFRSKFDLESKRKRISGSLNDNKHTFFEGVRLTRSRTTDNFKEVWK